MDITIVYQELMDTTVHEILHAEFPVASEKSVATAAGDIVEALWRMGVRLK